MKKSVYLTLSFASFLFCFCGDACAQLQSLSSAEMPCDKVFALDGNIGLGANNEWNAFEDLTLFDLNSGQVISVLEKSIQKTLSVNGVHYFLLRDEYYSEKSELYIFEDKALFQSSFQDTVFDIFFEPQLNGIVCSTPQGFVLFQNGAVNLELDLGQPLLSLTPYADGFLALTKESYHILNSSLSLSEGSQLPIGFHSFDGAVLGSSMLLTPVPDSLDALRPLSIFNFVSQELYSVVDSSGLEVSINKFVYPKGAYDDHFLLAGCGQFRPAEFVFSNPTDAGFIDPSNGVYTPQNARPGLRQAVLHPFVEQSVNGPILFGRMGLEGIEPYTIHNQQIEVLKDIYQGFGSSVNFAFSSNNYSSNPLSDLRYFDVVEAEGILYFAARSPFLGNQIWRTDGTATGTFCITEINREQKGFKSCHLSKDGTSILLTVKDRKGTTWLFQLGKNSPPVASEMDVEKNWEVFYANNPKIWSGRLFTELNSPATYTAYDGSSAMILNKLSLYIEHLSVNHKWVLPVNFIPGFYANTAVQIINADGALRSSALIRAEENETRIGNRSFSTGHTYVLVSHSSGGSIFIDDEPLGGSQAGHYLIEMNGNGDFLKATFLPTGGNDRLEVSELKITEEGIYVLGLADSGFDLNGIYTNSTNSPNVRGVVLKYSLGHDLEWISDTGTDQYIFGSGVNNLLVGSEDVFLTVGGTAYNASSSCSFSSWPNVIACLDKFSGDLQWRQILYSTDIVRMSTIELVDDQWLWLGGYTRGDIFTNDAHLDLISNYGECNGYNAFLMSLNTNTGSVSYLQNDDPARVKCIQDIVYHDQHLFSLSLVYEEELFPVPIYEFDGRWSLQLDKFTLGGQKVDSLIWPTSISRTSFAERLREHKFGFDFHPDGGIVLAGQFIGNGTIDGFVSPPSDNNFSRLGSWILQRRQIDELESSTLNEDDLSSGEFDLFPNPLTGTSFVLKIPAEDVGFYDQVILSDVQGRVCMIENLSGLFESRFVEVDGTLGSGVYLVELIGEKRSKAKKLVLRR